MNTVDLAKLFKEVDIDKLLPIIGNNVDIGKVLPLIGKDIDLAQLLPIVEGLDLEGIDIAKLLETFLPGQTLPPIDGNSSANDTFSFILPEETVQLLDDLLLNVLPVEALAVIDKAIDIDRLFSISLPTELMSVVNDSIKENAPADIEALLSVILPDVAPPTHGKDNDIFSFILPEETVQLLDGLLLEILPVEVLAKIDEVLDIDRLFSITLPTEVVSIATNLVKIDEIVDIDALVSAILHDHGHHHHDHFHEITTEISHFETHTEIHRFEEHGVVHHHEIITEISHFETHTEVIHHVEHGSKHNADTFSIILPEETVQLLDGLLLQFLSVETLAKIDEAIDIDRLFSITLPTETFTLVSDAIKASEIPDIDALVSSIVPIKDQDAFSFILPEETLGLVDEILFEIFPTETLARIDSAIDVERLFLIELPTELFHIANDAIVHNQGDEIDQLLTTVLADDAALLSTSNMVPIQEVPLI